MPVLVILLNAIYKRQHARILHACVLDLFSHVHMYICFQCIPMAEFCFAEILCTLYMFCYLNKSLLLSDLLHYLIFDHKLLYNHNFYNKFYNNAIRIRALRMDFTVRYVHSHFVSVHIFSGVAQKRINRLIFKNHI